MIARTAVKNGDVPMSARTGVIAARKRVWLVKTSATASRRKFETAFVAGRIATSNRRRFESEVATQRQIVI
jgi:hypothetical protein